jgi:hypothetical protein
MSAITLISSSEQPKISICSRICQALRVLIAKIKNFISRCFIEPFERARYQNTVSKNVADWKSKNVEVLWVEKDNSLSSLRLEENSPYVQKLKNLLSKLFPGANDAAYVKALNEIFENGSCYGQSYALLKCHDKFHVKKDKADALPKSLPANLREAGSFFHALQFLRLHAEVALGLKQNGVTSTDKAVIFDSLRKLAPTTFRHITRIQTDLVDESALALSVDALKARISLVDAEIKKEIPNLCVVEKIEGSLQETDKKVATLFEKFRGTAQITAGDAVRGVGHTILLKKEDAGCLVFDPYHHTWSFYEDGKKGVEKTLAFLKCFLDKPSHAIRYDISTIAAT